MLTQLKKVGLIFFAVGGGGQTITFFELCNIQNLSWTQFTDY
jgi:hypothetical protein